MATENNRVRHMITDPNFLVSNSTSHKWAFGAIAELVDNSLDSGASLFEADLEKDTINGERLIFQDNGCGMDPEQLHRMMSLGHCSKGNTNINPSQPAIGYYGNGFKSGSMRLGKDALVFTKDGSFKSIGFLSRTFLEDIKAKEVLVPIVSWKEGENSPVTNFDDLYASEYDIDSHNTNLKYICKYSMYNTEELLFQQLDKIKKRGTRIIIFNLRRTQKLPALDSEESQELMELEIEESASEFSLLESENDIILTKEYEKSQNPPEKYSLRSYLAILYLVPIMQIKVHNTKLWTKKLIHTLIYPRKYNKSVSIPNKGRQEIPFYFGFNQCRNHFGMMIFHKKRLITLYERVGIQLASDSRGVSVIGIVNVDHLTVTHNKQEFLQNEYYDEIIEVLQDKLRTFWREMIEKDLASFWKKLDSEDPPCWIQCSNLNCLKWRRIEENVDSLPENWTCKDNKEKEYSSCSVEEEEFSFTAVARKKKVDLPPPVAVEEQVRSWEGRGNLTIEDFEVVVEKERPKRTRKTVQNTNEDQFQTIILPVSSKKRKTSSKSTKTANSNAKKGKKKIASSKTNEER